MSYHLQEVVYTNAKYVKRAFQWCIACRMSYHPRGDTVEIVGVNSPTNGQSCEEHCICGEVVIEDVVLPLRKVQVQMNQQQQSAIAAFWVSGGIDRCRMDIFPRHMSRIGSNMMEVLSRLLRIILETVTVLQSARSFIETMVLPWQ